MPTIFHFAGKTVGEKGKPNVPVHSEKEWLRKEKLLMLPMQFSHNRVCKQSKFALAV